MIKSNVPTDWNAIVVTIPRAIAAGADLKDAAAFAWRISDEDFLDTNHLVLAQSGGSIIGVYQMKGWYRAEDLNVGPHFKSKANWDGRVGFLLVEAPAFLKSQYLGKKVSPSLQGVKFIRSTQGHLHTQDFAPEWWQEYCEHNDHLMHQERVEDIRDEVRNERDPKLNAIIDEILATAE